MVTGSARYTDDLPIPGALHAVFLCSVVAHARISGLDTSQAAGMPGVVAVLTAADLDLGPMPPGMGPPDLARPPLARDVVRFLGEAVAVVVAPAPMEPSTAAAAPDAETGGIILWTPAQAPYFTQAAVAGVLGLDPQKLRVVAPAVGGAFGARIVTYPEQVIVAALALRLERPVRYVESRSESMLAMSHGRGQVQDVELGATREGVITDVNLRLVADGGAYPGEAALMPMMTVQMLCGPYRILRVEGHTRTVATNTTPMSAYRGAGRPEATWLLERMIDLLASELELDPAEVRRRNLLPSDAFPYDTVAGARYDSGDYTAALDRALEIAGYERLRADQAERRRRGDSLQLGIGLSTGDHRHLATRSGPRDRLGAARRQHPGRGAGAGQGGPLGHRPGPQWRRHDGLPLAPGRRHRHLPGRRAGPRQGSRARRPPAGGQGRGRGRASWARAGRGRRAGHGAVMGSAGRGGRRPGPPTREHGVRGLADRSGLVRAAR